VLASEELCLCLPILLRRSPFGGNVSGSGEGKGPQNRCSTSPRLSAVHVSLPSCCTYVLILRKAPLVVISIASMSISSHPFSPSSAILSSPYHPNDLNALTILAIFSTACTIVLVPALAITRNVRPSISTQDQALVLWFVLCTCL